jgi:hypothetical protein
VHQIHRRTRIHHDLRRAGRTVANQGTTTPIGNTAASALSAGSPRIKLIGSPDAQNSPRNPNLPRSFWTGSPHCSLTSHSTQGSHSKGLNHGFWGLHARFNLKTAGLRHHRHPGSALCSSGATAASRKWVPVSSHPPTRTGWVPTTVMRHALAAFDTPRAAYFGYLTLALEFTSLTLTWPNSDAHIPIRTPIFRRGHATNQSGY